MKTKVHSETNSAAIGRFFYSQTQPLEVSHLPKSLAVFDVEYADLLQSGEYHLVAQRVDGSQTQKAATSLIYGSNTQGESVWQLVEAEFGMGRNIQALRVCNSGLLRAYQARLNAQGRGEAIEASPEAVISRLHEAINDDMLYSSLKKSAANLYDRRALEQEKLESLNAQQPTRFMGEALLNERRAKQARALASVVFPLYSRHAVIV